MKCLVTGVGGFVGSSLTDELLSRGHEVVGVDCFVDYYPRAMKEANLLNARSSSQFRFVEGDLVSLDLDSVLQGVDWVFHQAGQAGVRSSWGDSFASYTHNNVLGTQRLLEAAKRCLALPTPTLKKVVCASSSSVYGNAERYPTNEQVLPHPVSPYGVTKLASEHLAVLYAGEFGVPTVSLRYFTVYGPRQRPDMAFHKFIKAALQREAIVLFGDGEQSRDFTFISDIVEANILAAERGEAGAVLNIGRGSPTTVNQVLQIISDIVGPIEIRREQKQSGEARHTGADITLAQSMLGYAPKVSVEEGVRREVEWLRSIVK